MNKLNSFKDLTVWQRAVDLAVLVYESTEHFPPSEQYGLVSQMRRSAVSVSSNIAEGFKRSHKREKLQFYNVAYGSVAELESQIEIAHRLHFLTSLEYKKLLDLVTEISKMLESLIRSANSLNPKSYILNSRTGFSLAEITVSLGLFAIFVSIAVGGFAQALRSQRQVSAMIAANSNVSLTIEQMAREFRTGIDFCVVSTAGEPECAACAAGFPCQDSQVAFRNARDEVVSYQWDNATGAVERKCQAAGGCAVGGNSFEPITADNVKVENLFFIIQGDGVSFPQRITITLTVRPCEKRDVAGVCMPGTIPAGVGETTLQTTVSPRLL